MDRRSVLLGLAGLAWSRPVFAQRGFAVDWQGGPQTPAVVRSLGAQIALVEALPISVKAAEFFRAQPIFVDRADNTETRAGSRGIFFGRRPVPPINPVLLHELLHRYHQLVLPQSFRNPDILHFLKFVRDSGSYPANAYMFTNPGEFFAMCASVVLYGRAARPPSTRESVRRNAPRLYEWIVKEFDLRV